MKIFSKGIHRDGGSIVYDTNIGEVFCWRSMTVFGTQDFGSLWLGHPSQDSSRRLTAQEVIDFTNALVEFERPPRPRFGSLVIGGVKVTKDNFHLFFDT